MHFECGPSGCECSFQSQAHACLPRNNSTWGRMVTMPQTQGRRRWRLCENLGGDISKSLSSGRWQWCPPGSWGETPPC